MRGGQSNASVGLALLFFCVVGCQSRGRHAVSLTVLLFCHGFSSGFLPSCAPFFFTFLRSFSYGGIRFRGNDLESVSRRKCKDRYVLIFIPQPGVPEKRKRAHTCRKRLNDIFFCSVFFNLISVCLPRLGLEEGKVVCPFLFLFLYRCLNGPVLYISVQSSKLGTPGRKCEDRSVAIFVPANVACISAQIYMR